MGCDTGPGGDHCAHGFRSTASTLLNEEGAFDGDVVEAQLAHDTGKKGATPAWQGRDKNKIRGIYMHHPLFVQTNFDGFSRTRGQSAFTTALLRFNVSCGYVRPRTWDEWPRERVCAA